jgi:hypothetical protein
MGRVSNKRLGYPLGPQGEEMTRKISKPKLQTLQYLDFFGLLDWCEKKYKLNILDLLADLEAGNDSYCYTDIEWLEEREDDYGPKLAKILKKEFGVTDSIAFWVCW